jgi:hypothetical protein
VVSIFITTPAAIIVSIIGLVIDSRKWYAVAGLVISGAMAALIGGTIAMDLLCR